MKLNASARILYEEALKRGYQVQTYRDKHLLRITHGNKNFFTRGSRNSLQSSVGVTIADYKGLTKQILAEIGAPMASGDVFFDLESGLTWVQQVGFPVVYKPSDSRHGLGVVVGIQDLVTLAKIIGRKVSKNGYILEKVLQGKDFRILIIGHKFFAATLREPAFVIGDGIHSIKELITIENNNPDRGTGHEANLTKISIDSLVQDYLAEQNLTVDSVVAKSVRIKLRKTAGLSTGGVGIDVTDLVHADNRRLFESISKASDLNVVGIDVMAQTLEVPLSQQKNTGILELNASPGLRMHHYPYEGKPRNAAGAILDLLFS